ncbi:MAG: tetratricopeptide repeat protein [Pyrinomonadaceae bacterium]
MQDIPHVTIKELAHKIKGYGTPRFAFFLGAGASRQSGIITASEMVSHFKERIIERCCPDNVKDDKERDAWLSGQDWYKNGDNEYCKLFERFEQKEMGRQRYIESIIEGKEPSFGYVVLANLIASEYINTIITTNFDDLVYSACTTFTGKRPIVYAYGIMASEMRVTSQRPKILKLHGDFLFSTLKNTDNETAVQDPNMEKQLRQVLTEYGLIVVGYSGGDKSVMNVLSQISKRNDIYWCIRRGDKLSDAVEKLLKSKEGFIVEIDSFDAMMSEIRRVIGFNVKKMVGSIHDRQTQMLDQLVKFEPQYSAEILGEIVEAIKETSLKEGKYKKGLQAFSFYSQAYQAEDAGDKVKAEELYRKAIKLNPDYTEAYIYLGYLLSKDEARQKEAEKLYRKAIELNPNLAITYYCLGALLDKDAARQKEAEELYRKAIKLNPNDADAYSSLGILLSKDEARQEEAEAAFRKTIELNPNEADVYYNLGYFLDGNLARQKEAEDAYRKAIELNPNHTFAYNSLGALLGKDVARYKEAEAAFRKAIELNPNDAVAYNNLGYLLSKAGARQEEAEDAYRKVMELNPNDTNAYFSLGYLLSKDEARQKEAEKLYRKAIELNPDYTEAYIYLGTLLGKDAARQKGAEAVYRKAIELNPNDAYAYNSLGILLGKDEARQEEAEAAFRKAIELNPNYAEAYHNLGYLVSKDEARQKEAEELYYRKAIELNPNLATTYYCLGYLLSKDEARQEEAEAAFRKAIELNPNYADAYHNLGNLLRYTNRAAEAIPFCERAMQLEPEKPNYPLALAGIYKKLGQKSKSKQFSAQARELMRPDDWYNLACLESVYGNTDAAIKNLRRAVQKDLFNRDWAMRDPDLEWIRDDPRFKQIVGGESAKKSGRNKAISRKRKAKKSKT